MNFELVFFEDEVRDGFFVPAEMKHAWAAELEVLSEVDRICKKYHIQYYADWGTLLATVRHEGFIPWDDDLDIVMKREDYKRFLEVAPKELPEGYSVYNYNNHDDFWLFLARVVGKRRICFEDDHLRRFHEFPYIAGVDIFVLDYVSRDEKEERTRDKNAMYLIALADYIGDGRCDDTSVKQWISIIKEKYNITVTYVEDRKELKRKLYGEVEKLFAKFGKDEADKITQLFPFGVKDNRLWVPKEYYEEAIELGYENTTIPVSLRYCEMLSKKYGDYMKLVRNAGGHNYPFFESQRKQLQAVLDFDMPEYRFDYSQLRDNNRNNNNDIIDNSNRVASIVNSDGQVFYEYKKDIVAALEKLQYSYIKLSEFYQSIDTVCSTDTGNIKSVLQESQQAAIELGTAIESMKGENVSVVSKLEDYCELLYQQAMDIYNLHYNASIKKLLDKIDKWVKIEILNCTEIVFIVYKESQWKYIEKIYNDYNCNNDNDGSVNIDCYVMVVPYYYKRYDGTYIEKKYEMDAFIRLRNNVNFIDYSEYNLSKHHPDAIYIQNPYDEWNATLTLPPEFYSRSLRDCTEKLIYIPPFFLEEFTRECEREFYNMKYYCTMPGVVCSDIVYVQSDNMRQLYIDKLCEFAGESTRGIWSGKIKADESVYTYAKEYNNKKSYNKDRQYKIKIHKKKIAFYVQAGVLIQYGDEAIDKLKRVIDIFSTYKDDIEVLWVLDDVQERYLEAGRESYFMLFDEYVRLKNEYHKHGIGAMIYRSDISIDEIVEKCDAYYGCESHIALEFNVNKKPVMILSVEC